MLAKIKEFLQSILPGLPAFHLYMLSFFVLLLLGTSPLAAAIFPAVAKAMPQQIAPWLNLAVAIAIIVYFLFLIQSISGAGARPTGNAGGAVFSVATPASCLTVNANLQDFGRIYVESFTFDEAKKTWVTYEIFEMAYNNNQYKIDTSAIRSHLKNESDPFKPFLLVDKSDADTLGKAYYALFNIADVIVTERGDINQSPTNDGPAGWRIYFLTKNQFPLHPVQDNFACLNHTLLPSAG